MNQPVYNPAFYYPAYPTQPQNQPTPQPYGAQPPQSAGGPAVPQPYGPQPQPPAGTMPYPQPYGAYPAYPQPVQPGYYQPQGQWAAPPFAIKPPKDPRKTGGARAVNRLCLLVLVQIVISFLAGTVVATLMFTQGIDVYTDELAMTLYTVALSPVGLLPPFVVYMLMGKKDWNRYFRFERKGFFTGLLTVFGGLGICLAANIPANLLLQFLVGLGATDPNESMQVLSQSWPGFWLELAGIAVMVPVVEEFVFRGVIFSSLERFGTGFAVVGSGLIFGLTHLSIASVVFAMVAGLVMGFAYAKTRNLWVTVSIHALNNGLAVVMDYAEFLVGPDRTELLQDLVFLVPIGVGVVSLVLLLVVRLVKGRRKPEAAENQQNEYNDYVASQQALLAWQGGPAPAEEALQPLGPGESLGCLCRAPSFWCLVAAVIIMLVSMFL